MGKKNELQDFLRQYPKTNSLELLIPDINGIFRCKRIPRQEFEGFFETGVNGPATTLLLNVLGEMTGDLDFLNLEGDPDRIISPVPNTLAPITWLGSETGQVISTFNDLDGKPILFDPRNVLKSALEPLYDLGLSPMVATELEFYLIEAGDGSMPNLKLAKVPGTGIDQGGIQYAMPEDLWDNDEFLEAVRAACAEQDVPMTTVHSEYSPGQYEINLHHVRDPIVACDQTVLLKRIIKGVARQHGMAASFMAKPFERIAGCGLHIHFSLYDQQGENIFADLSSTVAPAISEKLRCAIGGLIATMPEAMAIFAPNANSYRRLVPGNYAPLAPNWGYNHRDVSLRIPVSGHKNRRLEHRVAGADANPYLVMAAVAAGIHHGIISQSDPGEMIGEGVEMEHNLTLPRTWDKALEVFESGNNLSRYIGAEYHRIFSAVRRSECDMFAAKVSNVDYEWYLRSI